jgi:hypothetical protein
MHGWRVMANIPELSLVFTIVRIGITMLPTLDLSMMMPMMLR